VSTNAAQQFAEVEAGGWAKIESMERAGAAQLKTISRL